MAETLGSGEKQACQVAVALNNVAISAFTERFNKAKD